VYHRKGRDRPHPLILERSFIVKQYNNLETISSVLHGSSAAIDNIEILHDDEGVPCQFIIFFRGRYVANPYHVSVEVRIFYKVPYVG
jgi:hypothetical protein